MDVPPGVSHILTAAVSGGSTVVVGVFRFTKRLKALETKYKALRDDFNTYKEKAAQDLNHLKQGWRLEIESFKSDVERTIEAAERQSLRDWPSPESVRELQRRLQILEDNYSKLKDSDAGFVKQGDFAVHVREQQDQWRKMERTLGQIEGMLKPLSPQRR